MRNGCMQIVDATPLAIELIFPLVVQALRRIIYSGIERNNDAKLALEATKVRSHGRCSVQVV